MMLVSLLLSHGCSSRDEPEDAESVGSTLVTDITPTSDYCNSGLKGGECVAAPPASASALSRLEVDGDRGSLEYAHALTLPYTDTQLKATAKVFVQAVHGSPLLDRQPDGWLYLYFDDIPFRTTEVNPMSDWTLEVYVDGTRFGGTTMCFDSRDRRYEFNFAAHERHPRRVVGADLAAAGHVRPGGLRQVQGRGLLQGQGGSVGPPASEPARAREPRLSRRVLRRSREAKRVRTTGQRGPLHRPVQHAPSGQQPRAVRNSGRTRRGHDVDHARVSLPVRRARTPPPEGARRGRPQL